MKREKLNTREFKEKEKLYNNFVEYFGNKGIQNYEDAKIFLKEIIYNSNFVYTTKCSQELVQYFDLMKKDVETKYDIRINRSHPGKGLIKRLRYKLQSKQIKQTYQNFAKFELEFLDVIDISLSNVRANMNYGEETRDEKIIQ